MKVKAQSKPVVAQRPAPRAKAPKVAGASRTWAPKAKPMTEAKARAAIAGHANAAVHRAMADHARAPSGEPHSRHPHLAAFGRTLGVALGVIVTEALAVLPGWNKPVLDAQGKPAKQIEGADRIGNHDLRKRHEEVVGPQVEALVKKIPAGALHDLLDGFGKGASEAPGDSYRLEAAISDALHRR